MKKNLLVTLNIYINIYIYSPVSLQWREFIVLVIRIEIDEQVECRCTFKSQSMEWRSQFTIFSNLALSDFTILFFFSDIQYKSVFGDFFGVFFCAGTNTVGFITLLESIEKSSFSVTAFLLLLILFYYSFHFL